jgi:hypothetical protein
LWNRAYGRAPRRDRQVDSARQPGLHIVGIAPAAFKGRSDTSEVWVSMIASAPPQAREARGSRGFPRSPGSPRRVDRAGAGRRHQRREQLAQAYPETNEKRGVEVSPLAERSVRQIRPAISLLFGASRSCS